MSAWKEIGKGVPQWSILGSLLFLVYVNDRPVNIKAVNVYLFADDTAIFNTASSVYLAACEGRYSIQCAKEWFDANLNLNNEKQKR